VPLQPQTIDRLFPTDVPAWDQVLATYPPRALPQGAEVVRVAPSPTGFMHIGGIFAALLCERIAHRSGGVFFLRIEDTDKAREVPGAVQGIIDSLHAFGIELDEGPIAHGEEVGRYGPYTQSHRVPIYRSFVRELVRRGLAYPCFATAEELDHINAQQEARKEETRGYHGHWAIWRDRADADVQGALDEGRPFVFRFRSEPAAGRRIVFHDLLKGEREMPANHLDWVLLKSDGLPTYHCAHVVDDRLMGTTLVLRGDEWFPSVPLHVQLSEAFGWGRFRYAHISPIQKMDGESRRKLSKRHDPEANVLYYRAQGIPARAVVEYLLTLASADFEPWRAKNPAASPFDFQLAPERITASSGALFDMAKLADVSREAIAKLDVDQTLAELLDWARAERPEAAAAIESDRVYSRAILAMDYQGKTRRKDFTKWSDFVEQRGFFYDALFVQPADPADPRFGTVAAADVAACARGFLATFDPADDRDVWFTKVKAVAKSLGYAESAKEMKASPGAFKGSVADVANAIRVMVTGRQNAPDLHTVMQLLGADRVRRRVGTFA
jgi:glutamyl-tRNA synthetase